jgi:hypothetical protein
MIEGSLDSIINEDIMLIRDALHSNYLASMLCVFTVA